MKHSMSPQDRQKLDDIEKRLIAVETARNISFVKEIQRQINTGTLTIQDGASSSGTTISVRNATDTGSETVADDYDGVLTIYKNGVAVGRIGYYS